MWLSPTGWGRRGLTCVTKEPHYEIFPTFLFHVGKIQILKYASGRFERIKDIKLLTQIAEKDDDDGVCQAARLRLDSLQVKETVEA